MRRHQNQKALLILAIMISISLVFYSLYINIYIGFICLYFSWNLVSLSLDVYSKISLVEKIDRGNKDKKV